MKELSIEEKAKAYDKALERARKMYNSTYHPMEGPGGICYNNADLETLFPELKESEDERIRKEIIAFLTYYHTGQGNSVKYDDGWIAWLEKQGGEKPINNQFTPEQVGVLDKHIDKFLEQKPSNKVEPKFKVGDIVQYITDSTDRRKIEEVDTLRNMYHTDGLSIMFEVEDEWKVVVNAEDVEQKPSDTAEPKFKVGDWIVYNDIVLYIFHITINKYYDCGKPDGTLRSFDSSIDAQSHLWTIEDAKEGDVLVVDDRPFIYNGNVNPLSVGGYCGITCDGHFKKYEKPIGHSTDGWTDGWTMYDNNIHPATKEQRDTLFEKMRESGYDWEAEKKELNPIFDTDEEKDSDYHTKGEIIMTRGELLEFLTKEAIKFREKPNFININKHLTGIDENNMPSKEQIDGVLVAFINHIGISQCIDYALSYKDLEKEKQL